jgi:trans-aconitate methyltransferase
MEINWQTVIIAALSSGLLGTLGSIIVTLISTRANRDNIVSQIIDKQQASLLTSNTITSNLQVQVNSLEAALQEQKENSVEFVKNLEARHQNEMRELSDKWKKDFDERERRTNERIAKKDGDIEQLSKELHVWKTNYDAQLDVNDKLQRYVSELVAQVNRLVERLNFYLERDGQEKLKPISKKGLAML